MTRAAEGQACAQIQSLPLRKPHRASLHGVLTHRSFLRNTSLCFTTTSVSYVEKQYSGCEKHDMRRRNKQNTYFLLDGRRLSITIKEA